MKIIDEEENKKKRKKDQFSVTIIGIIVYSVILIFVMAGTYLGIKKAFKNYEAKKAVEAVEETVEETAEETEEPEEEPEEEVEQKETVLDEHGADLSSFCDSKTRYIDFDNIIFTPNKRDESLSWRDNVFSRIENIEQPAEAVVNGFDYKRLYAYSLDGTKLDYEVYTNPENDLIEKIKTIAYTGDVSEIITYYYDLGNINYITHYKRVVDVPIDITSGEIESRYYFADDVMVKYVFCENDTATEYIVSDIGTYSEGTVEQYDFLEKTMLNRAYINYNIAKGLTETEVVTGYVLDEFNSPLEGAKVAIYREGDGALIAEGETDADGLYSFEIETDDTALYKICATKDTLREVDVHRVSAYHGSGRYDVEPIYMSYENNGQEYNLQILVRDATDMSKALPYASIKFRSGINNTDGEVLWSGNLNEAGAVIVPIRAGSYTAEVSLGGYEDSFFSAIVKLDHQAILGYAVPDIGDNTVATILSWDTTPLDLDARVISSNAARILKSGTDSIGSTTPEVIYIEDIGQDDFRYYVSDYTACTGGDALSYNMSSSNATVSIYNSDGIVASYHVPAAHGGVVWEVFRIHNLRVLPVNQYYYSIEQNSYWTTK